MTCGDVWSNEARIEHGTTPMSSFRPVALVTGAARRLGAAIARNLHAAGYDVSLHYRHSGEDMRALVADLNAERANSAVSWAADLAEYDRLPELVAKTVGHFGRLDALVNNASAFSPTPLGTITPADWDGQFLINARAPLILAQAAAPHLKHARGGIVNLTDIYAERPLRDHVVYCMSKAALLAGTRALALELAPEVRVNAIAPGGVLHEQGRAAGTHAAGAYRHARRDRRGGALAAAGRGLHHRAGDPGRWWTAAGPLNRPAWRRTAMRFVSARSVPERGNHFGANADSSAIPRNSAGASCDTAYRYRAAE
jgi:pteridine reductase